MGGANSAAHDANSTERYGRQSALEVASCDGAKAAAKTTWCEIFAAKSDSNTSAITQPQAQTPITNNMGVSSSHGGSEIGLDTGGLDKVDASLYGSWPPSTWNGLAPRLNAARKLAEREIEGAYIVTDDGDRLEVAATGVRHGVYCKWSLSWEGCKIDIVDSAAPSENRLSVHVSIGSIRLMKVGYLEAWTQLLGVLCSLGYEHHHEVIGRIDPCADFADQSMFEIQDAVRNGRLITKAGSYSEHGKWDEMQTYSRGKGPMMIRIYDKAKECAKDPVKQAVMIAHRWGKPCKEAVRVEFQLRRKTLQRVFSVKTAEEVFANLGTITEWCTKEWFRLTECTVDRKNKNQSRAATSEFWLSVQDKFKEWTGSPLPRNRLVAKPAPDFKALEKQAVGCVAKIAAHYSEGDFKTEAIRIIDKYLAEAQDSVKEKRQTLAVQSRVIIDDSDIPF